MLKFAVFVCCFLVAVDVASAQQQPDPATLQEAIAVLRQQRESLADQAANLAVQLGAAQREIARLKADAEKKPQAEVKK